MRVEFANLSDVEQRAVVTQMRERARGARFSEDVVAVHATETGKFRSLNPVDYDLANPKIRVLETQSSGTETVARVSLEFTPKRSGLKTAILEVWIRIKSAISDLQARSIIRGVELRIKEIFGAAALGEEVGDPLILLQRELKRLQQLHGLDIEAQVKEGAGDWHLTAMPGKETARHG